MWEIMKFLQGEMEKPGLFSLFHIISLLIVLAATILLSVFFKDCKEKTYKRILFIVWICCLVLEIIKQFVKSFVYGPPHQITYDYYDIPLHLCSTILYVLPILIFTKREKLPILHDAITGYICFFVSFGGLVVLLYTDIVMSKLIFTNVQTMIHHGSQVALGVFMVIWNRNRINIKMFFKSIFVLLSFMAIALIVNIILTPITPRGINMFYVNPYQITDIPFFSTIQEKAGFFVFLLSYTSALILAGFVVYLIDIAFIRLNNKLAINKYNRCH